jgi:hypothetical protein
MLSFSTRSSCNWFDCWPVLEYNTLFSGDLCPRRLQLYNFLFNKVCGKVAVCVQLYCRWSCVLLLMFTLHVSAYMAIFRCVWYFTFYSWRNPLRCFCCMWLYYAVSNLCLFVVFPLIFIFLCACLVFLPFLSYNFLLCGRNVWSPHTRWTPLHVNLLSESTVICPFRLS